MAAVNFAIRSDFKWEYACERNSPPTSYTALSRADALCYTVNVKTYARRFQCIF
jgi:hypothetical protein